VRPFLILAQPETADARAEGGNSCLQHPSGTSKRTSMKDTKDKLIPANSEQRSKTVEEYRERLNREDMERRWNLEALDSIITESEERPEEFHQEWILPLLLAGVSLETAFSLLVQGKFHPN
jgi:hypothetical protein